MFDHYVIKITSIRLNSDGAKGKDEESAKAIESTLYNVDIYCKDGKQTKAVGQCTNSGRGVVTWGAEAGLSDVKQQGDVVYYMDGCMLHAASKLLQNATEKTFEKLGLGEETFQKFIDTCWYAQKALCKKLEVEWNSENLGVTDGPILDLESEDCIVL